MNPARMFGSSGRTGTLDTSPLGRYARAFRIRRYSLSCHCGQIAKKNALKPWLVKRWCIGKITGDYLWRMEDILTLYEEPYDLLRPVVCFDERPCLLLGDILAPLPMKPMRTSPRPMNTSLCFWGFRGRPSLGCANGLSRRRALNRPWKRNLDLASRLSYWVREKPT